MGNSMIANFPVTDVDDVGAIPDIIPSNWIVFLEDGREIFLTRIQQLRTYGGYLCGMPSDPERDVSLALAGARTWDQNFHGEPFLVPAPIIRCLEPAPRGPRSFAMPWAILPQVTTFAQFRSQMPARDDSEVYSSALFVWWQPEFGMPSDTDLIERIRAVSWERYAKDWTP